MVEFSQTMSRVALIFLSTRLLFGQTPQSPQEILKEAVTLQEQGKLAEAIRDYDLFLDMYPDAAEVRSNLGAALAASNQYARAIEEYKLALLKKPDPQVRLNLALAYYKTTAYRDAAKELETVHAADPGNRQAVILLADCRLRTGENKKTIDLLTPMHDASPNDVAVDYILGTALARDGQVDTAQQVINPLLTGPDSAEKHLLMGTTRFAAHDFPGALKDLRIAAEMNPDLPQVNSYYAQALFSNGQMEESRVVFEKELARNPDDFESNLHVGMMLRSDGSFAPALRHLNRALTVRPGNLAVRYQIALVRMAEGKDETARNELEQIVKEAPNFSEGHVSLATIYFREKRKEDGNRERAIVQKLTADRQAQQPGAKLSDTDAAKVPENR
jgi:tetratricopeptide (TPR) repeat protein